MPREPSARVQVAERAHAALIEQKERIDQELAEIKAQLTDARGKVARTGEYADPDWWNRASYAARRKARDSQRLQREIGESRRKLGKLRCAEIELCFVEVARGELPIDEFMRLWMTARVLSERRAVEAEGELRAVAERESHGSGPAQR